MDQRSFIRRTIGSAFAVLFGVVSTTLCATAEPGCRTGGPALANAYILSNPLYAIYYGELESHVARYPDSYREGADAIRCARALAQALMVGSIQSYDPMDLQRQQQLNAELGSMGISPGQQPMSPSGQLYMMSQHFARLARVLPPAARGDYGPLYTPANEIEQMQMFAGQMLRAMLDPATLNMLQPIVEQAAEVDYRIVIDLASGMAAQ